MANDCCFSEEEIRRYVCCDLPDEQALLVEGHLEACDLCQQRLVAEVGAGCTPTWLKQYAQAKEMTAATFLVEQPSTADTQSYRLFDTAELAVGEPVGPQLPLSEDSFETQIDSFQIVRCIAKGGMSEVYEAFDTVTQRSVALKVMRSASSNHSPLQRIMTEAQALARLSHPQIVAVHDVISYQECPVLVLEYVAGITLEQWQSKQLVDARLAAMLVRDLALAVSHAHERGVVHRDLKPANVMLRGEPPFENNNHPDADLQLKITDFGISRLLDRVSVTQTGEVLGTPAYMAPEQTKGLVDELGPAVDIYGLGAILYELLTGRPPFVSADPIVTLALVRDSEPISPKALRPDLPIDLNTICLKCLEKRPDARYESALSLAHELTDFLADRPITTRPIGALRRGLRWCRRNRGLTAALSMAGLGLALTLIGAILFARMQSELRREADAQRQRAVAAEKNWQNVAEKRKEHFSLLQSTVLDFIHGPPGDGSEVNLTRDELRQRGTAIMVRLHEDFLREIGPPSEWTKAEFDQLFLYNRAVARTKHADNILPWLEKGEQGLEEMAARGLLSPEVTLARAELYDAQAWHAIRKNDKERALHYGRTALDAWKLCFDQDPNSLRRLDDALRSYANLTDGYYFYGLMEKGIETSREYAHFLQSWFQQGSQTHQRFRDYLPRLFDLVDRLIRHNQYDVARSILTEANKQLDSHPVHGAEREEVQVWRQRILALESSLPPLASTS